MNTHDASAGTIPSAPTFGLRSTSKIRDRPKYACAACQANVVIAPRLPEPIEKGLPGSGLMAQVVVSK